MRENYGKDLLALTVVALAVRLAWLQRGVLVTADGSLYLSAARNLVFHHVFSHSQSAEIVPTVSHPPLYPSLIALLWWRDAAPFLAVGLLQAALSAATVALVYLIARDCFNRTAALVASAGMLIAPMSSFYTSLILTETLFTFLITLGVFLWGRKQPALCGVVFGLAALTRTTMLPFLVLLLLLSLWPRVRRSARRTCLVIALVALAVSSVWIVRNGFVTGKFVPVATGSGLNLLFGTIETSITSTRYWTGSRWAAKQRELPVFQADEGLPEVERDRARARRALTRIIADPLGWLVVRAKQYPKLFIDTGTYVLDPVGNAGVQAQPRLCPLVLTIKAVFILGNLMVTGLAAFGIFLERARIVSLGHIALFPLYLSIIHLPIWIEPRYSLPMMPLVAIFAAVGALRLARKPIREEHPPHKAEEAQS